jgi:hypothetical protein
MISTNKKQSSDDFYCLLYVDAPVEHPGFVILINDFLNGEMFSRDIDNKYLSLSVMKNEDYDHIKKDSEKNNEFLYYRYYIEIDPAENVDYETFMQHINELITFLQGKSFKTKAVHFRD